DRTGFLDASVLGETVHPRNFNTLRRIRDEDGAVVAEEEEFAELASSEFLQRQLRAILDAGGREMLEDLPDGIHSGLARPGHRAEARRSDEADRRDGAARLPQPSGRQPPGGSTPDPVPASAPADRSSSRASGGLPGV